MHLVKKRGRPIEIPNGVLISTTLPKRLCAVMDSHAKEHDVSTAHVLRTMVFRELARQFVDMEERRELYRYREQARIDRERAERERADLELIDKTFDAKLFHKALNLEFIA